MLLALNAGTAEIRLGCLERGEVLCAASLETRATRTADEYAVLLERMLALHGVDAGGFEGAALASVVPPLTATLAAAAELVTGCRALVVGAGVKTGLNIGIDDPSQLGADLVAAAVGALERHAPPAIVVDVGTATNLQRPRRGRAAAGRLHHAGARAGGGRAERRGLAAAARALRGAAQMRWHQHGGLHALRRRVRRGGGHRRHGVAHRAGAGACAPRSSPPARTRPG